MIVVIDMSDDKFFGQDFTYEKEWTEIYDMLVSAMKEANGHLSALNKTNDRHKKMYHMRNYKALQGVITALRWTLGDKSISVDILLGRD